MKTRRALVSSILLSATLLATASSVAADRTKGRGTGGIIYVESQGLYYDTFGAADLVPRGRFQELRMNAPDGGPSTEFGPGEPGYLGGRWWVDENGNGVMDLEDTYFLCPLLGPGRSAP